MVDSVPLVKVASPLLGEEEAAAVREVLLSGQLLSGPRVAEFERLFADYIGVKHAIAVSTGTVSLQASMAALGIGPGDEVIVPALTFFSSATSVIHQGGVPVFCDISLDNFCMDPDDLAKRITPRTKAIMPVHYFGHSAEMEAIRSIADANGLSIIEDCAQAHGTEYKGRRVGSFGELGSFSFYATKHITTGEGGAVTTDDDELADYVRKFRNHGMEGRDDHVILGSNFRLTEMGGAIGVLQMGKLEGFNESRIAASEYLIEQLEDVPWLEVPKVPDHVRHTYFWCHLLIDESILGMTTQALIAHLRENGIEVRSRYQEPLYKQPLLNENIPAVLAASAGDNLPAYGDMHLPNAERAAGSMIGLPNRPGITRAELDRVVEVVRSVSSA